ncbi:transmembrane protein 8B-like isoform X2 [Limulus polyphemus]|uniref:Transmembrane protein 8B-like isoform X2 n=1 Tax=Limulus polyphemus TaxID=6850 RepID=A0ABM1BL29_LIMPO|nr:transmembrane protein 8B-like isoform X2 [Limulus polyphemus]
MCSVSSHSFSHVCKERHVKESWSVNRTMATGGVARLTLVQICLACCMFLENCNLFKSESTLSQVLDSRELYPYRAYKDVQIFHYTVPHQVSFASWEFEANGSTYCSPKPISVFLQFGSYPVINPQNESFPDNFFFHRKDLYHVTMLTNSDPVLLNVTCPTPGDWFVVAFMTENSQKIVQKGLYHSCQAWFSSSLSLNLENSITTLYPGTSLLQHMTSDQFYRFFTPKNTWSVRVSISNCKTEQELTENECSLMVMARALALPSSYLLPDVSRTTIIDCSELEPKVDCALEMIPIEDDWNYILISLVSNSSAEFTIRVEIAVCEDNKEDMNQELVPTVHHENIRSIPSVLNWDNKTLSELNLETEAFTAAPFLHKSSHHPIIHYSNIKASCWDEVPLVRYTLQNLAFKYDVFPGNNSSVPAQIYVSTEVPTLMRFDVFPLQDIGGTLALKLALPATEDERTNDFSVEACVEYGLRPILTPSGACLTQMSVLVNSSSWYTRLKTLMIPYPQAGSWYISLLSRCYLEERNNNASNTLDVTCNSSKIPVIVQISSLPCILGKCGDHGKCYQYISGGFIFSTCVCSAGWQGWGCTDSRHALSYGQLLQAVLLLTLSNIFFIPAIVLAFYRHYYIEGIVFFLTMSSSMFYHACDTEIKTFCLMRLSLLQYCDFYLAVLALWVTLIAMANLSETLRSFAHMGGAVGIAIAVEYDRTGLWTFVIPAAVGFCILSVSWVYHCRQQHSCYPKMKTWFLCILPGALFAAGGVVLFAILETQNNYTYVHSAWHATMALSVLFLLPKERETKASTVVQLGWKLHGSLRYLEDNQMDEL